MIGYGSLLIDAARENGFNVAEWRAASLFARLPLSGRAKKFALNLDRFIVTPIKLLGRRASLVHVVDPGNCIYVPLTRHTRSVVTVHDMIPWLSRDNRLNGFSPTFTGQWLMKQILKQLGRSEQIICDSESTKRDLLNFSTISSDSVRVVYIPVFQRMGPSTSDAATSLRTKLNLPLEAPLILHIGRNFYKNREAVLQVTPLVRKALPDTQLVLVGKLTSAQRALAEQLELGPALHVLTHVSSDDMATLYSTSALLLFPSLYEGFGLPVVEARMCGTPVVCSNAGSLPEVAGLETVVTGPNAIDEMAAACISLIRSGARPEPEAPPEFDLEAWTKTHSTIYKKLLMI